MFTLFHVFELIGSIVGSGSGLVFGMKAFGWIGALLGAGVGYYIGLLSGRLPYAAVFSWMRRDLKRWDTATLKSRLEHEYCISHYIIAELVVRGEPIEQFKQYILALLQSDSPKKRWFGETNMRFWFPEESGPLPERQTNTL